MDIFIRQGNEHQKKRKMKSMKKILLILLISLPIMISAQEENQAHKNEFGTDATVLVSRLLGSSTSYAPFELSYKRHFDKFSFRSAIAFRTAYYLHDTEWDRDFADRSTDLAFRIGLEKGWMLSNKLRLFYGIDLKYDISYDKYDYISFYEGWVRGRKSSSSRIGISPLFGVEYKITDRISLQTEGNFTASRTSTNFETFSTQVEDDAIDHNFDEKESKSGFGANLSVPNALTISVRF